MTIEAINFFKSEVERLGKLASEKLDFLRKAEESFKNLDAEKQKIIGEVNQINGALHGFNTALSVLSPKAAEVAEAVEEVVEKATEALDDKTIN